MRSYSRPSCVLITLLTVGAALIAGCSSGTPAASTTVTVTARAASSVSTSPSAQPTATTPAGPGPCQSNALKVTLGPGSAAAGTAFYQIRFTNGSNTACTLYGFPGVSFTGETYAVQVGPAATRNPASHATVVRLAPGAVASAEISVVDAQNYPPGPCGLTTVSGILVYPPNLTISVGLPFNGYTCVHKKDHVLSVNTVVAGPGTPGG
jgi:hypothetical protein